VAEYENKICIHFKILILNLIFNAYLKKKKNRTIRKRNRKINENNLRKRPINK
jgi:hypothetical protein